MEHFEVGDKSGNPLSTVDTNEHQVTSGKTPIRKRAYSTVKTFYRGMKEPTVDALRGNLVFILWFIVGAVVAFSMFAFLSHPQIVTGRLRPDLGFETTAQHICGLYGSLYDVCSRIKNHKVLLKERDGDPNQKTSEVDYSVELWNSLCKNTGRDLEGLLNNLHTPSYIVNSLAKFVDPFNALDPNSAALAIFNRNATAF